jgi:DNA-binding transcriptional LysR family regulator
MNLLEGIRVFVRVAQCGSFSAAAREFGMTQPNVSKLVAALETHLGVRLFNRSTRRLRLTEEGLTYLGLGQKILDSVAEADAEVGRARGEPSGLVRLGSPYAFARRYLVPHIGRLLARHRQLRIEVISSDQLDNLVEHGLDLAIRFGNVSGDVVARRVGTVARVAVAAPSYLKQAGSPRAPRDLSTHSCLVHANPVTGSGWTFRRGSGRETIVVSGNFSANSAEVIREACMQGLGIAVMPQWLFHDELAAGSVRRVLRSYEPEGLPVFLTYPSRRFVPLKLKVVTDYLAQELAREPALRLESGERM